MNLINSETLKNSTQCCFVQADAADADGQELEDR